MLLPYSGPKYFPLGNFIAQLLIPIGVILLIVLFNWLLEGPPSTMPTYVIATTFVTFFAQRELFWSQKNLSVIILRLIETPWCWKKNWEE